MRFFFDTEFIEDGRTIDLLSIGIVSADGREYYAEVAEADHGRASQWVKDNVVVHLQGGAKPRQQIAAEILAFVGVDTPQFWAYYADYDWVAMCQLFGTMMDLPEGWPMYCRDLQQRVDEQGGGVLLPEQVSNQHHALADARWTRDAFEWLHSHLNGLVGDTA